MRWLSINPPIRGSIDKGRNVIARLTFGINPPIRGSIADEEEKTIYEMVKYQSPYKGFNRTR